MGSFNIVSQQKVKSESAHNGLNAHNKREYFSDNIDKSRTHKNITLSDNKYHGFKDFIESKRKMIREYNKANGTKNRMVRKVKNKKTKESEYQATSQELIFTHSPGVMSEEQSIRYLKHADNFLRRWFQNLEVLSSIIHLDETTPHLHFNVTYFDESRAKFCQKNLQDRGLTDINLIRKGWQEYLADTEFASLSMQDGSVVEDRKHLSKANLAVAEAKSELKAVKSDLARAEVEIKEKDAQIESNVNLYSYKIDEKDEEIEAFKAEVAKLHAKIEVMQEEVRKLSSGSDLVTLEEARQILSEALQNGTSDKSDIDIIREMTSISAQIKRHGGKAKTKKPKV